MSDNITLLSNKKPDEQRAAIEKLKRDMANFVDAATVIAAIRMINYKAYIKEGFTPDQALILCQK